MWWACGDAGLLFESNAYLLVG
ncbi:hypothetical protein BN126350129 [Stenotrophomonas thermophila]|nr:hypothetical protein BN126350129 [Stenotrophomonas maltophilia]